MNRMWSIFMAVWHFPMTVCKIISSSWFFFSSATVASTAATPPNTHATRIGALSSAAIALAVSVAVICLIYFICRHRHRQCVLFVVRLCVFRFIFSVLFM